MAAELTLSQKRMAPSKYAVVSRVDRQASGRMTSSRGVWAVADSQRHSFQSHDFFFANP